MKKFKVIWYEGSMNLEPELSDNVLKEIIVKADSIDKVNFIQILPKKEREVYATSIKYCVRTAWPEGKLEEAKKTVSDYGSHFRFIYVEEVE